MTPAQVEKIALWYEPEESSAQIEQWDEYVAEYLRSTPEEDQSENDLTQYLEAY